MKKNKKGQPRKVSLNEVRVSVVRSQGEREQDVLFRQLLAEMDRARGDLKRIKDALEYNAGLNGFGTVYSKQDHFDIETAAKRIQVDIDHALSLEYLTQKQVNHHSLTIRTAIARLAEKLNDLSFRSEVQAVSESTDPAGDEVHNHGVRTVRETGYQSLALSGSLMGDDYDSLLARVSILAFALQGVFYLCVMAFYILTEWIPSYSYLEGWGMAKQAATDVTIVIGVVIVSMIASYPFAWVAEKVFMPIFPFWIEEDDSIVLAIAAGVYVAYQFLYYLYS